MRDLRADCLVITIVETLVNQGGWRWARGRTAGEGEEKRRSKGDGGEEEEKTQRYTSKRGTIKSAGRKERERGSEGREERNYSSVSRGQFYTRLCKCRVIATARLLGHLFTHFDRKTAPRL